jgi:hypothetical protein
MMDHYFGHASNSSCGKASVNIAGYIGFATPQKAGKSHQREVGQALQKPSWQAVKKVNS